MWDQRPLTVAQSGDDDATRSLGIEGALARETPITTGLDARPEATMRIPRETYLPVILAAGLFVFFLGLLVKATFVGAVGVVFAAVGILWWTWRTDTDLA